MKFSATLVAAAATAASAKLEPITMKGSKLFYTNGTQFFMKGVAYQQDTAAAGETNDKKTKYIDPLADEDACKRDIPLLKELGTNIIRTYAVNPKADHKACMKLLDDAGIYVISDLSEPSVSINRDDPKWDIELYERYIGVVDELAQYDNVVGFFAGNEVSNNVSNTQASAFVKAAVRDTKAHIKSKYDRWLGVGYASNDDVDIREDIADYFNLAWDKVCLPRTAGGLNILDITVWNRAAVSKLLWNLCCKKDSLWVKWVHCYYIKNCPVWSCNPAQDSWVVQKIMKNKTYILEVGLTEDDLRSMQDFPIKKIYVAMRGTYQKVQWSRIICNNQGAPKWIFLFRLAALRRLHTKSRLLKWGIIDEQQCVFCNTGVETTDHLFFECPYGADIWSSWVPQGKQCRGNKNLNGHAQMSRAKEL